MTPIRERKTQKKKNWKGSVDVKTRSERRKEEKKKVCFCTIATAHRMQNKNEIALKA
jgi:hypothetical protein